MSSSVRLVARQIGLETVIATQHATHHFVPIRPADQMAAIVMTKLHVRVLAQASAQ